MKKRNTIFMAGLLALALLASCKKDNNTNQDITGTDLMRANIEQPTGNGSRTHIEVSGNEGLVRWNEGDQFLAVDNNGDQYTFTLVSGQSSASQPTFRCFGSDNMGSPFAAVYPATNSISGTTATITLPATQPYAAGSFANGTNVMVGYQEGSEREVDFKNVLGGLCFPLVGNNVTVTSLVLTSNSSEPLCGTFTVDCNSSEYTLNHQTGTGGNSITVDCGAGVTLSSAPTDFYFMVPPGTLESGFTVKAYYNDTEVLSESTTTIPGTGFVVRNAIKRLNTNLEVVRIPEKAFSVAEGRYVWFAPGNLQYRASADGSGTDLTHFVAGGGTAYGEWRFAEHQYDCIGNAVGNTLMVATQTTWIDLLCWGTSGWNNGNTYYNPYDMGNTEWDYGYGYGPTDGTSYAYSLTGDYANADWGVYNSIFNSATGQVDAAGTWHTLTSDEWFYLKNTRPYAPLLYGNGSVEGVNGGIFLPDNWILPDGMSFTPGANSWSNVYNAEQWAVMEDAGAVFLPAGGFRTMTYVMGVGSVGYYWSSTYFDSGSAYHVDLAGTYVSVNDYIRCHGHCVRLVRDAN